MQASVLENWVKSLEKTVALLMPTCENFRKFALA